MLCKDPVVMSLKQIGYNTILFPKADISPSQLLKRSDDKLRRLGDLTSVFVTGPVPPPTISVGNAAPNLNVTKTADLKIGFGLSILSGLIGALGGSTLGLNTNYSRASSLSLEFTDITEDNIQPAQLDRFLTASDIDPFARAVRDMLEGDKVCVITSLIKSKKVVVAAKDKKGADLEVNVPELSKAVGGNLKLARANDASTQILYEGNVPLAIGFQAEQLIFDNGEYRTMEELDAGDGALEAAGRPSQPDARRRLKVIEEGPVGSF